MRPAQTVVKAGVRGFDLDRLLVSGNRLGRFRRLHPREDPAVVGKTCRVLVSGLSGQRGQNLSALFGIAAHAEE